MQALLQLISNVKNLQPTDCMGEFFSMSVSHRIYVLDLNRLGQLYYKGVDSRGLLLGHYAAYTLRVKEDPMLAHVTLKETGDFYNSFQLKTHKNYIEIEADTMKGSTDLMDEWGENILGLTEESQEMLSDYMIRNNFKDVIQQKILNNI